MSTTEEEVEITTPFGGSVASDEQELAIDEAVPESSAVPNWHFVPDLDVVVREEEECVRRALEEFEASDSRTEEANEGDSFVDIMGGLGKKLEVNRKDSLLRTFCKVPICCQRPCWRVRLILLICLRVSLHLHISLAFVRRTNMVAIHFFHKLVLSARLYLKMASWGFCVLVFDSSGEPVIALKRWYVVFRTVPEPSMLWGALRPRRRLLAPRLVLPWKFRQVCRIVVFCFGKLGTL